MFGYRRSKDREQTGVLAARQAVGEARHPRAPEPTARSVLGSLGPREVAAVAEDATVFDALRIMAERDTAAVAVTSSADLVGIFSERDNARMSLKGNRPAKDTPVVEVMTRLAPSASPADGVRRCLALMTERGAAHIVVLDEGRLVGLLSRTDLLQALATYHERVFHETELDRKLLNLRGTYSC